MSSKKRELEIVYNLEWKNKPASGDEKSNMVGILDIPATTLDWKTFKSYLLKNSGAADENVKVSYVDSEDREKAINSQLDFEIALYTFRHKARMNEIITLKLDCINSKKRSGGVKSLAKGFSEVQIKMNPKVKKTDDPPEWFLTYMKKFKEELVEEISSIYSSKAHPVNMYHSRKLKADSYKRARKTPLLLAETINDKELSKSAKIERKLESKLEKLEHKTMKIKAKKMALRGSSDSDVGKSSGKNETAIYSPPTGNDVLMNASVTKKEGTRHMTGGEPYCQTWEISNSGTLAWTSDTELRYAWGSQALKPINKEVPCPPLKPGEKGTITVFLEIPKATGTYECYWHFYHKGRRFGHWLGCEIIVDPPPVKNTPYLPSPKYDVINIQDVYELVLPTTWTSPKKSEKIEENHPIEIINPFAEDDATKCGDCYPVNMFESNQNFAADDKIEEAKDVTDENIFLHQDTKYDTIIISDSDNQSIVSISDSNSSVNSATSEDFVMLKMSSSPKSEEIVTPDLTPVEPNLAKMNVSAIYNIDIIDNMFTKLSMGNSTFFDDLNPEDLNMDGAVPVKTEIVEPAILAESAKVSVMKNLSSCHTMQQIPIDLSNKSSQDEIEDETGYAYIHYQGQKIPISKKHLSQEYLTTAESVPEYEIKNLSNFKIEEIIVKEEEPVRDINEPVLHTSTPLTEGNNGSQQDTRSREFNQEVPFQSYFNDAAPMARNECSSTCGLANSMTSSTNENRFFVFPQFYPGYEVVPPLGASYIDPNPVAYQPVYKYNTVGEVIVNDWSTGLNYSSCTVYPNATSQYCGSPTNIGTPNMSRGCSSAQSSVAGGTAQQSPQSPTCTCNFEPNSNPETVIYANNHSRGRANVQNMNSNAADQPKVTTDSRGSNRVGVPDLLSGATVVATSAINTARNVLNMFVPPRNTDCGRWQNGHWISTNPESKREKYLRLLHDMGFSNRDLNATLLARYNDDVNAVVSELLQ